jgi:hypothetical protein
VWPERISTPPRFGDQREHVAGAHKVFCMHIGVGQRVHGCAAFFCRDAGRQAFLVVDRHGESGAQRRVIVRHHRVELQPARIFTRHRCAHDAGAVPHHHRHLLGGHLGGSSDQVALVLAVIIVHHHNHLAGLDGGYGAGNGVEFVRHGVCSCKLGRQIARLDLVPGQLLNAQGKVERRRVARQKLRHAARRDAHRAGELRLAQLSKFHGAHL